MSRSVRRETEVVAPVLPSLSGLCVTQKTAAPGSAEPQLCNACLGFWSVKAELGLRVPGREGPVSFKIWCNWENSSSAELLDLQRKALVYRHF